MPPQYVKECWAIFKDVQRCLASVEELKQADMEAFNVHGHKDGLTELIPFRKT